MQASRRYAGMRRGAEWQAGRRAVGGRQASIRLVCRQTAAGRLCALIRHAVCCQSAHSGGKHGGEAGRQADGKQAGMQAG